MKRPIYFDYMATTPADELVIKDMIACMGIDGAFGNPASSSHYYGFEAQELVDRARQQVATVLSADPREIIWTSGATEADNLAIKGVSYFYKRNGCHIITMSTEHRAVLDTCKFLQTQGFDVTYLDPEPNGLLDLRKLKKAIRADTILISIMHVNNETGVVQDIASIGELALAHGVKYHVDATQSIGKIPLDLSQLNIDLLSVSAHKVYGPKGIGALYVRRQPRVRLQPLMHGGEHEQGLRSGTLPTQQIVGMGRAFELAHKNFDKNLEHITTLSKRFWDGLSKMDGVYLNGDAKARVPHCLNIRFAGIDSEALLVSMQDVAASTGSACGSANPKPSHVLTALGLNRLEGQSSVRFSLGKYLSEQQIDHAVKHIIDEVTRLRELSPLWDKVKNKLMRR